jgi:hypothetical protein
MAAVLAVSVTSAWAQPKRFEVTANLGWTFSDGVTSRGVLVAGEYLFAAVDPKDSLSWGIGVGVMATGNVELGFLFSQQKSALEISGTATRTIGDLDIDGYHGYFAYNFGEVDASLRPYVLAGMGATSYGGVRFTRLADVATGEVGGRTQFSTTWGAGVKMVLTPTFGARFGLRWTPTFIKSDSVGWWCDPYWGCYVVEDLQYANQWDFFGGATIRF